MKEMFSQPWNWLYAACFLDLFSASLLIPVLNTHLRAIGLSHTTIGLLSSIYGVAQLLTSPIIGSWSDIYGRSSILILSLVVCSIGYGLMGIFESFLLLVITRCVIGTFKHAQTLCRAFVADIVPVTEQSAVHGLLNAFTSLAFMVGPLMSGHIMELENGFQYLTGIVSLIFILNSSLVYTFAQNSTKLNSSGSDINRYAKISLVFTELYCIEWKRFGMFFSIKLLFSLGSMLYFQNLGVMLTENFGVSPRYIGYTISFYGFMSVMCNLGVGKIKRSSIISKTHLKCVTFTLGLMTITFFVLYAVDNYFLFVLGLIPLAGGHAMTRIFLTEILLEKSEASCRGSLVGASSSVVSIARILTPFTSGVVIAWGGTSFTLLCSASTTAVACLLTEIYSRQTRRKSD